MYPTEPPPIIITQVMFGDQGTTISWMETREQTPESQHEHTATISNRVLGVQDVDLVREALADLVDRYQKDRRSPPPTLPSASERLRNRQADDPDGG